MEVRRHFRKASIFVIVGAWATILTLANPALSSEEVSDSDQGVYKKNRLPVQMVSGPIFSPTVLASSTPVMDYWQTNIRFAWMFSELKKPGTFLQGNLESLLEITNSVIYKGFGSYMGGLTALFRYNFIQTDCKLVPYVQAGIGLIYTDAHPEPNSPIGQAIEFTPQASFGVRYLIKRNWSIDAEVIFHHISNAGLAHENRGINASGAFMGLTYYFDTLLKKKR